MNVYLNVVRISFLTCFVFTNLTYLPNITKLLSLFSNHARFNQRHVQIVWINLTLCNQKRKSYCDKNSDSDTMSLAGASKILSLDKPD